MFLNVTSTMFVWLIFIQPRCTLLDTVESGHTEHVETRRIVSRRLITYKFDVRMGQTDASIFANYCLCISKLQYSVTDLVGNLLGPCLCAGSFFQVSKEGVALFCKSVH